VELDRLEPVLEVPLMGTDDLLTSAECDYDPAREQVRGEEQAMAEEELERQKAEADKVEPPEALDLRPYAFMTDQAARAKGRFWLGEMRSRGHKISSIPVVYCDACGDEQWIEVEG
jgi:hypothetical protein